MTVISHNVLGKTKRLMSGTKESNTIHEARQPQPWELRFEAEALQHLPEAQDRVLGLSG